MNDEQRSAKDEAGPQDLTRGKQFTEPTDDDTAAHGMKWNSPEPAVPGRPGPGEAANDDDASSAGPDETYKAGH